MEKPDPGRLVAPTLAPPPERHCRIDVGCKPQLRATVTVRLLDRSSVAQLEAWTDRGWTELHQFEARNSKVACHLAETDLCDLIGDVARARTLRLVADDLTALCAFGRQFFGQER